MAADDEPIPHAELDIYTAIFIRLEVRRG